MRTREPTKFQRELEAILAPMNPRQLLTPRIYSKSLRQRKPRVRLLNRLLTGLGITNKPIHEAACLIHKGWDKLILLSSMVYNAILSFQNARSFVRKWNKFWGVCRPWYLAWMDLGDWHLFIPPVVMALICLKIAQKWPSKRSNW